MATQEDIQSYLYYSHYLKDFINKHTICDARLITAISCSKTLQYLHNLSPAGPSSMEMQ